MLLLSKAFHKVTGSIRFFFSLLINFSRNLRFQGKIKNFKKTLDSYDAMHHIPLMTHCVIFADKTDNKMGQPFENQTIISGWLINNSTPGAFNSEKQHEEPFKEEKMIHIKRYANGQFFDTINKKYIKVAALKEMVEKGEKIKVTLSKTGKDITESVIERFSKKEAAGKKEQSTGKKEKKSDKKTPFLNTDSLKKWANKIADTQITQILETVKLPSKKQIESLDASIKELNKKIDKLEKMYQAATAKPASKKAPKNTEEKNAVNNKA